jgi:hypothetical protein
MVLWARQETEYLAMRRSRARLQGLSGFGPISGVQFHSKSASMRRPTKVKAEVAAVLNSFRTNQVLLESLVDAIHRCRASVRTLSGPLLVRCTLGSD